MRYLYFLTAICLLCLSCQKEKDANFNITLTNEVEILATLGIEASQTVESLATAPEVEEAYNANKTNGSLVKEMRFSSLRISIVEPEGENLGFIKDISIFIQGADLPELQVGSASNVQAVNAISFNLASADIKNYINSGTVSFKLTYTSDGFTQLNRNCTIAGTIAVKAVEQ